MLSEDEIIELTEGILLANELELNSKDEKILRDLLRLVKRWKVRAELLKKQKEKKPLVEKGMSFADIEKLREYSR